MSRAFVREPDTDAVETLLDRPISRHPNFVTPAGLAKIGQRLEELEAARSAALATSDAGALPAIERDLRYWRQRRASARVIAPPSAPEIVRFGVTVALRFEDGTERRFQIVGEDEADPARELLSWASPVGSVLIGRLVGDVVEVFGQQAEIVGMHA